MPEDEANSLSDREITRPDYSEDEDNALEAASPSSILIGQEWSGPLPPPSVLSEHNLVENGAERLFRMAERRAEHDITMESESLKADSKLAFRGQWFGLIVVLSVLVLAGYMTYLGATAVAAAVVAIDVAGLAAVFVYSRLSRRGVQERHLDHTND